MLVNASRRVGKGRPKNYIPEEDIRPIAAVFLKGEPVEGEVAVITREQAAGGRLQPQPEPVGGAGKLMSWTSGLSRRSLPICSALTVRPVR